jgi:hypothetical protein
MMEIVTRARAATIRVFLLGLAAGASACRTPPPPSPPETPATATPSARLGLPDGWTAHPIPSNADWDCAGWQLAEWAVFAGSDGRPQILEAHRFPDPPLPFAVPRVDDVGPQGRRHVVSVADGFIVGFDAGEFGGRAFWFSKDGRQHHVLTPFPDPPPGQYREAENVHALVAFGPDVLAFQGLAHLGGDVGRVTRIHRERDGRWRATLFASLPGAPQTVVAESPTRWLIAVPKGIVRLHADARVEPIWSERSLASLYPNSAVALRDGSFLFGMRHFVLRVRPRGGGNDVDVLLAPECIVAGCACHGVAAGPL